MDTGEQLAARTQDPRAEGAWEGRLWSPVKEHSQELRTGSPPHVPFGFRDPNATGEWAGMSAFHPASVPSTLSSLLFPELALGGGGAGVWGRVPDVPEWRALGRGGGDAGQGLVSKPEVAWGRGGAGREGGCAAKNPEGRREGQE